MIRGDGEGFDMVERVWPRTEKRARDGKRLAVGKDVGGGGGRHKLGASVEQITEKTRHVLWVFRKLEKMSCMTARNLQIGAPDVHARCVLMIKYLPNQKKRNVYTCGIFACMQRP